MFESQQDQLWADDTSEKDSRGVYVHKYVKAGDEVRGGVPPKCIARGVVKEVESVRGRPWDVIPRFAPAGVELPTEALQPEIDPAPVAKTLPTPQPEPPREEPKTASKAKSRARGRGVRHGSR